MTHLWPILPFLAKWSQDINSVIYMQMIKTSNFSTAFLCNSFLFKMFFSPLWPLPFCIKHDDLDWEATFNAFLTQQNPWLSNPARCHHAVNSTKSGTAAHQPGASIAYVQRRECWCVNTHQQLAALSAAHSHPDQLAEEERRSECACKHRNGHTSETKSPPVWDAFDSSGVLYGKVQLSLGNHFLYPLNGYKSYLH